MGRIDGARILDSSTVALMTTVQFPAIADAQGLIWGIGWWTIPGWGTYLACGHTGAFHGATTGIEYMLEANRHLGVVILTNGESQTGMIEIADALYVFGDTLATGVANELGSLPEQFVLSQNYPNPFNPSTTIKYQLPAKSEVTLRVYDVLGREIATLVNEVKQPGTHTVQIDGSGLASGVYFYQLRAGAFASTKKFLLLR
jgi:hypothetical protein